MISFTIPSDRHARRTPVRTWNHAFTLPEVIIAAGLSAIVLAGVVATFLMIGRSGANAANYSMSEAEIRRGIEEFSQDLRMANSITWNSATSVTLTVPDNYTSTANQVTYAYDTATSGATAQCFYRVPGDGSSTTNPTIFVRSISSFQFQRFNRLGNPAANDAETKRIQVTLNVRRAQVTLPNANTVLVSASYILRNKAVH